MQVVQVSQVQVVTVVIPQLQLVENYVVIPEVVRVRFTRTSEFLGTARRSSSWTRLLTCPLVCNDLVVVTVQKTAEVPQLQYFDKVVDVPVVLVPQLQFIDKVLTMAVRGLWRS